MGGIESAGRAGRKPLEVADPEVSRRLRRILDETTAGNPMSLLKWTGKSTRTMAAELSRQGHPVSAMTVCRCLWAMEYSLQGNVKSLEASNIRIAMSNFSTSTGKGNPSSRVGIRDLGRHQEKRADWSLSQSGSTWRRAEEAEQVLTHDFPSLAQGKAVPYGTYDVAEDQALVNVGITHDTAEFAVSSIQRGGG